MKRSLFFAPGLVVVLCWGATVAAGEGAGPARVAGATRVYENVLKPLTHARPILGDFPEFVEPVRPSARFEAPALVDDPGADLEVRAWRYSYNARGTIEMANRLRGDRTAVIVVHPWGVDDGQGWRTPEPAGVAFQCTPLKNQVVLDHAARALNPFLKAMRGKAGLIAYSLPGAADPIRAKMYRSFGRRPGADERAAGRRELEKKLGSFNYRGGPVPRAIAVSAETPTIEYFKRFQGLDAGPDYNPAGYWDLPIPVMKPIEVAPDDLVIYDGEGYPALRDGLRKLGVRHVLLAGYNTDLCVCSTTAGYKNLARDFDVFLVGDATIASSPAQSTPRFSTHQAVCRASMEILITQASWIAVAAPTARAAAAR